MSAAQIGKPATKRHWELELLRIFSMFLIVATHYFASDDSPSRIDPALAQSWKSALHAELIRRWASLSREYREALPELVSVQAWEKTFGL